MRQLLRRAWYLIRGRRLEADLAEEIEFHRALKQRELEESGLDAKAATFATRRALGSVALAKDRARDVWRPRWLQGLGQDLRLAVRTLWANKLVSAVAVLSLTLGIGANFAIFSLINSLLIRTLPVREPGRLVLVSDSGSLGTRTWNFAVWDQLRQRPHLFEGVVAWSSARFNLASGGEAQFVDGFWASGSFFDTLGVPAFLGRSLSDVDDRRGGGPDGPVVVISYSFWQRHFAGAANAIGHSLTLDNVPFTVVGVAPPEFFGADVGRTFDVVVPLGDEPLLHGRDTWLERRDVYWLNIMARLRLGESLDTATTGLRGVQPQIREATLPEGATGQYLDRYLKDSFVLVSAATGNSGMRRRYERALSVIMGVVVVVLLIACANIANLLLARAMARRPEFSLRLALGASRWRLVRQLLVESMVLAGLGAVFGLLIASWGSRFLMQQLSTQANTVFLDLGLDDHALGFMVGITVMTALLFSAAPAFRASGVPPMEALKENGRVTSAGGRFRLANSLVVAQVALSVVLIVAAGLFVRTFVSLATRNLGFDRDRVLMANVTVPRSTWTQTSACRYSSGSVRLFARCRESPRRRFLW